MSADPCQGWLRRNCRFEPRYDLSAAQNPKMQVRFGTGELADILEQFRAKTYVHDVCVRCGKIVKRGQ